MIMIAIRWDLIVGALSGLVVMAIGANIGLIAGYYGGKLDNFLMRLTDAVYGLPLEPFAIIIIAFTGQTIYHIAIAISLVLWRTVARVIRSEVLTIRNSTYVEVARDRGISNFRIIYGHIAPNIFHLLFLYLTFSIAWGIIFNASISFLGFGDHSRQSLGTLLQEAWSSGVWAFSWWTFFFPGLFIFLLVVSVFFIGQAYEEEANPKLKQH
jgi:peptide/nickel transport system permease protein